jgi:hypothetical protein
MMSEDGPPTGAPTRVPVFTDGTFEAATLQARAAGRWLVVDIADASNPASWATLYTTWRDPDLVAWVERNAIAVRFDCRIDGETLRLLRVDPGSAPMVILFRDGKERLRIRGHNNAADLLKKFERVDLSEENLALARIMLKNPERDAFDRSGLARALLGAGLLEEALSHYDWLWCHWTDVEPEGAGVRVSFMANEISELCARLPAARARFSELRDAAGSLASPETQAGREACLDFVVLNDALNEDEISLSWFISLSSEQRRALPRGSVKFHLLPLLYERESWAEAGSLLQDPLEELEEIFERARTLGPVRERDLGAYERHLIIEGRPGAARRDIKRLSRGLYRDVAAIYRSLIAAARDGEAAAVKDAALRFEDTPAMRAALQ